MGEGAKKNRSSLGLVLHPELSARPVPSVLWHRVSDPLSPSLAV